MTTIHKLLNHKIFNLNGEQLFILPSLGNSIFTLPKSAEKEIAESLSQIN